MKFGDQVVFTENGKEYQATVLAARELDGHSGENNEPLLQIGFFADKPGVLGTSRQNELVQFRTDVTHESHAFTPELQAKNGQILAGGRWREVGAPACSLSPTELAAKAREVKEVETPVAEPQPEPIDDITREALIRNKQEELKAAAAAAPAPQQLGTPEPPAGGDGTGSIN
jgi:hypothetical protein